ncbi:unnamed protein product [Colias eurytheme]|nr:unnamed protein product [Colias eurytheme]
MSAPAELSFDEILKFMLAHNGKVTNHDLVKHFKVFLMNPNMRDEARNTFKKHVNALAIIKNQNNEKWLILKKKYLPSNLRENEGVSQSDSKLNESVTTQNEETAAVEKPEPVVEPPYKPPPPLQLNQDFNILGTILQDTVMATSPIQPLIEEQDESKENVEAIEDVPPKVHPRRKSSEKSITEKRPSVPNISPRMSIPNDSMDMNETPPTLTSSRSESMLIDSEQKISVKERKQMFNRMASESDVLKSNKLSFNSSDVIVLNERSTVVMHDASDKRSRSVAIWQENMTDFIVLALLLRPENHLQPSTARMPRPTSLVDPMEIGTDELAATYRKIRGDTHYTLREKQSNVDSGSLQKKCLDSSSSVDEEDRVSLDHKESDPLDSKQKQWILCAARGEYHVLAKMCKENAKLVKTKKLGVCKCVSRFEEIDMMYLQTPYFWKCTYCTWAVVIAYHQAKH